MPRLGLGLGLGRRSGGTAWAPSQLSGLVLWLKANGSYEVTAGGGGGTAAPGTPVGRWLDASGAANHADAPLAGSRPTRRADGRGVTGNGAAFTLLTPNTTLPAVAGAGWSWFIKWKRASASADGLCAAGYRTALDYRFNNTGTGGAGAYFDGTNRDCAPADTNENVVGIVANTAGGGLIYKHDGTTTAFVNYPSAVAIGLSLLSHNNADEYSNDTIIEVAAYSRALTGPEAQQVRAYLGTV